MRSEKKQTSFGSLRFLVIKHKVQLIARNISDVQALSQILTAGGSRFDCRYLILSIMLYTHWQLTLESFKPTPLLISSSFIFKNKMKPVLYTIKSAVFDLNIFVQEHIARKAKKSAFLVTLPWLISRLTWTFSINISSKQASKRTKNTTALLLF